MARGLTLDSQEHTAIPMSLFDHYTLDGFYDEMFLPTQQPRPHYRACMRLWSR